MVEDVKIDGEFPGLPQDPIDAFVNPLRRFLHIESASGVLLILTTISALILANSAFSANFFACAGYKIIDNPGFESAAEGVKASRVAHAEIVVLCSSDDEYPQLAPAVNELLDTKTILVVAGAPACMEDLKKQGIENFIHMRSDLLETLTGFHHKLGITL